MAERSLRADPNAVYALGQNPEESARLQRQADELALESKMVLERTGLALGQSARTVLVTVPEPAAVVTEMVRLTRPGGWVASVAPDTEFGAPR